MGFKIYRQVPQVEAMCNFRGERKGKSLVLCTEPRGVSSKAYLEGVEGSVEAKAGWPSHYGIWVAYEGLRLKRTP